LRAGSALVASPAHLSRIPEQLSLDVSPSLIFSSGGPLSFEAAQSAREILGSTPVEILGSTETGGVAWRRQDAQGALWTPLPQVEIEPDEENALTVRSPFTGETGFLRMGDQMERAADGRFALRPRLDRVVKIEGKRVSLPRVEEVLKGLADIIDVAAVDLPERGGALGAVVVLAADARPLHAEMGNFRFSRRLRRALSDRLEPMERPRYWRFVKQIAEDAQGKRPVASLRALFMEGPGELPLVTSREVGASESRFELELHAGLRWFEGHFPTRPILPGVAQLHIAAVLAEEAWGDFVSGREMSRVKFRHVMQPGEKVTLVLERKSAERVDFRYVKGDETMASGAIKGGPA
jgi:hypothetical protein